jgi:hypothetical protein
MDKSANNLFTRSLLAWYRMGLKRDHITMKQMSPIANGDALQQSAILNMKAWW